MLVAFDIFLFRLIPTSYGKLALATHCIRHLLITNAPMFNCIFPSTNNDVKHKLKPANQESFLLHFALILFFNFLDHYHYLLFSLGRMA